MQIGKALDGSEVKLSAKDLATAGTTILAMRGAGKSWLAGVIAEQMALEKFPFAIVDPEGEYWTLRVKFSNIVVAGGEYGDIPIDISLAETLAQIAIDERLEIVIDLSDMRRKQQFEFMSKFLSALFASETKARIPFWVCFEEADLWIPQTGNPHCKTPVLDLCQRGRKRGLGFALVSQRPAVIDKTALSQAEFRFFKRFSQPHDLRAVAEYLGPYARLTELLPSLSTQEALFYAPTVTEQPVRFVVSSRITPHGGTTPAGVKTVKPSTTTLLLKRKLEKILEAKKRERESAQLQESQIKLLQKRINELEKELEKTKLASDVATILSGASLEHVPSKVSDSWSSIHPSSRPPRTETHDLETPKPHFILQDEMIVHIGPIGIDLRTGIITGSEFGNLLLNRLNSNERVVFLTLLVHGKKMTTIQLSKKIGWSPSKVRKIIKQLLRKGLLKPQGRSKGGILYTLT